jgi:peroxiredoxin
MTAIAAGRKAPLFTLAGTDGQNWSLEETLARGPVVAAFFKVSCPVCQFTFPFLERIWKTYGNGAFTILAVSQDDPRDTKDFCKDFGITFPAAVDAKGYPASNDYGLTNVPSIFLIGSDGKVQVSCVGFSRADLERIAAEMARQAGKPAAPLFRSCEVVPDYKPG